MESIRHFADCVIEGKAPLATGVDGLESTRIVAAIHEVARAVDFDILPREFLPNPAKTGVGYHFHRQSTLLGVNFVLEKGIDAKGVDTSEIYWHVVCQL